MKRGRLYTRGNTKGIGDNINTFCVAVIYFIVFHIFKALNLHSTIYHPFLLYGLDAYV